MSWTSGTIGTAARLPGAAEASVDPAWQPWLDLLAIALEEGESSSWESAVLTRADRPASAPLLHGALLRPDHRRIKRLLRRLAASAGLAGARDIDASLALRAAIVRDDAALAEMAEQSGVSVQALTAVAQVAAMPLLRAAARTLDAAARDWRHGYCPVCGAWPSLVELRGIERERRLRCGSCSADWSFPLLRCAFCDETDHRKLGSLLPEGEEQLRRIETCENCHGYLKAITTLSALPVRSLMLLDLATVPLDLAAQDRGYARPARPGFPVSVEVAS